MTCAAVVVSYNRRDLLREVLAALTAQTRAPEEIIVIDNGSTDGTRAMLAQEFTGISVYLSAENIGGAGGFALGVDLAIAAGHSDAWLMDDDAVPHLDALARLLGAAQRIQAARPERPRPGFLTCRIVEPDGTPLSIWQPAPLPGAVAPVLGVTPLPWSPFVGVLVNLDLARTTFLPMADFFIWLDDLEYTARLGRAATGYAVEDAFITHPNKSYVKGDFGWRFEHVVKNRLWILGHRDLAIASVKPTLAAQLARAVLGQAVRAQSKPAYLRSLGRGLRRGLAEQPVRRPPGGALRGPDALRFTRP
ncbi:MAG: glycosyltransferase family 2 protein [Candidatus Nanopelagicales bacterium]